MVGRGQVWVCHPANRPRRVPRFQALAVELLRLRTLPLPNPSAWLLLRLSSLPPSPAPPWLLLWLGWGLLLLQHAGLPESCPSPHCCSHPIFPLTPTHLPYTPHPPNSPPLQLLRHSLLWLQQEPQLLPSSGVQLPEAC